MFEEAVVFAGPSIPAGRARAIFPRPLLPPIQRGDLDRLRQERPEARFVGIIDGRFFQNLAISPKEVLLAMQQGIRLYGSSSMGALRAAELEDEGMIGVGKIFEMFHQGIIDADDEAGAIDAGLLDIAVRAGREIYFPERTYLNLLNRLRTAWPDHAVRSLEQFLRGPVPDLKREDAQLLLERLRTDVLAERAGRSTTPGGGL